MSREYKAVLVEAGAPQNAPSGRQRLIIAGATIGKLGEALPVYLGFDVSKRIGEAIITRQGNALWADIVIEDDALQGRLWPALGVNIKKADTDTVNNVKSENFTVYDLTCLGLCPNGNADPKIPALKLKK